MLTAQTKIDLRHTFSDAKSLKTKFEAHTILESEAEARTALECGSDSLGGFYNPVGQRLTWYFTTKLDAIEWGHRYELMLAAKTGRARQMVFVNKSA